MPHGKAGVRTPQAALWFTVGHRIEAVQFYWTVTCSLCLGVPEDGESNGSSRDLVVAKLCSVVIRWSFVGASCFHHAQIHPNSRQKEPLLYPQMDKTLDAQFLRVEKALATLIASISTYNPNPVLAHDLVAADQELSNGLADCMTFPISS